MSENQNNQTNNNSGGNGGAGVWVFCFLLLGMIAYGGYQKELKNASLRAQKFLENNSEYIKNNKALEIWGKTHNFEGYIMGGARGQKTIPHK